MRLRARSGLCRGHRKGFGIAKTFAIHKNSGHLHFPMSHPPKCSPSLSHGTPPAPRQRHPDRTRRGRRWPVDGHEHGTVEFRTLKGRVKCLPRPSPPRAPRRTYARSRTAPPPRCTDARSRPQVKAHYPRSGRSATRTDTVKHKSKPALTRQLVK